MSVIIFRHGLSVSAWWNFSPLWNSIKSISKTIKIILICFDSFSETELPPPDATKKLCKRIRMRHQLGFQGDLLKIKEWKADRKCNRRRIVFWFFPRNVGSEVRDSSLIVERNKRSEKPTAHTSSDEKRSRMNSVRVHWIINWTSVNNVQNDADVITLDRCTSGARFLP